MPGPTSHAYFSQRLRLHYVDWGNAEKPPLLLLHGGRDHCRNCDWTAEALRDEWHVICPDLRGHGDSQWSPEGNYTMAGYIYDLAQLVHQQRLAPVSIIAHFLGGNIALRYAGLYPECVTRLVAIEGLGPSPADLARRGPTIVERMDAWIREQRGLAGRLPRRYVSPEGRGHGLPISDSGHRRKEESTGGAFAEPEIGSRAPRWEGAGEAAGRLSRRDVSHSSATGSGPSCGGARAVVMGAAFAYSQ